MGSKLHLIYVITHKNIPLEIKKPHELFYVGGSDVGLGRLNEISGYSIASKNKQFCELTAHYWVWKNIIPTLHPNDYIGFCHYRRYFTFGNKISIDEIESFDPTDIICKIFNEGYNCILPTPLEFSQHTWIKNTIKYKRLFTPYTKYRLIEQYDDNHILDDLLVAVDLLPIEHRNKFEKYIKTNYTLSAYNMYIARVKDFNDYFKLLFAWLFEVENKIDISSRDAYQSRLFGFLAERFSSYYFQTYMKPYFSDVTFYDL